MAGDRFDGVASAVGRRVDRPTALVGAVVGWVGPLGWAARDDSLAGQSVWDAGVLWQSITGAAFYTLNGFILGSVFGYLGARLGVVVMRRWPRASPEIAATVVAVAGAAFCVAAGADRSINAWERLPLTVVLTVVCILATRQELRRAASCHSSRPLPSPGQAG